MLVSLTTLTLSHSLYKNGQLTDLGQTVQDVQESFSFWRTRLLEQSVRSPKKILAQQSKFKSFERRAGVPFLALSLSLSLGKARRTGSPANPLPTASRAPKDRPAGYVTSRLAEHTIQFFQNILNYFWRTVFQAIKVKDVLIFLIL